MNAFGSAAGSPIIDGDALVERVRAEFGVSLSWTSQVFGGQDSDAAVMQAATADGAAVAVKISRNVRIGGCLFRPTWPWVARPAFRRRCGPAPGGPTASWVAAGCR